MQVELHRGWAPGIIGFTVATHARYYAREWGFGPLFEARVAAGMGDFMLRYDPTRDLVLRAELNGDFIGTISVDGSDPALPQGQAHLRWFIMSDSARGQGAGRLLFDAALAFMDEVGFSSSYLTTFAGLDPARHLYEQAGFILQHEERGESWGTPVVEQLFLRERPR